MASSSSDSVGAYLKVAFILKNKELHVCLLILVSQNTTYEFFLSLHPIYRRVRGSSFLVLLVLLFVHLQNKH